MLFIAKDVEALDNNSRVPTAPELQTEFTIDHGRIRINWKRQTSALMSPVANRYLRKVREIKSA